MSPLLSDQRQLLVTYLRPQRLRVTVLGVLLFSSIGLQLVNPQILKSFLDGATQGATNRALASAAGAFLAIALIQQVCAVVATYLSENVGWTATNALRADLLLHCLRLDQSFHKTRTPGELIERIDGDVTTLANFFSQLVIQVLGNGLLLIGVIAILWASDWRIGLLMTIMAVVVGLVLKRIQAIATPFWRVARQRSAELFGFIEERLAGTEDVRSSGAQGDSMRRLYSRLGAQMHAERRARLTGRLGWTTSDVLFTIGTAATYLLTARLFNTGSMSIGNIYVVFFYIGLLFRPLAQLTQQAEDFQKAGAGIMRIRELLTTRSTLADSGETHLPDGPLAVAFDHVSFGYENRGQTKNEGQKTEDEGHAQDTALTDSSLVLSPSSDLVLHDLSFRLEPGRVLGILGRTGSGKTTLTRLLFRLYDPQGGTIELGDVDLRNVSLAELRRRVGVVTQEVQLFHATIRDNLTLFDATIPDERIMSAIDTLGLRPWYQSLPEGLDTVLASGGGLSAGQAQLLAFTRIFLRDPGLVILDEASSRLDPATEQLIERAVDTLLRNRTGIIIAHRLHTVYRADEILILEEGAPVEHGERIALMNDSGSRFAHLLGTGLEEALA